MLQPWFTNSTRSPGLKRESVWPSATRFVAHQGRADAEAEAEHFDGKISE